MSRIIKRSLLGLLTVVILAAVVAAALAPGLPRRSFPQVAGEIRLAGLDGAVDVYRDAMGVPHIYAASTHDLFFAHGYVHAQDRFWQMDFWRHTGSGRLSEMFGESQLDTDKYLRTLGWARVAKQELATMDEETLSILQAYADGVNAYLADHQGSALSLEYAVLKVLTPGYTPEPWEPLNTLTWAKAMAWDLRGNMDEEIERAYLLKTLSPAQVDEIFPPYPGFMPVIVPPAGQTSSQDTPAAASDAGQQELYTALDGQFDQVLQQKSGLDDLLGAGGVGIGSNNWVISGRLTATGKPLLADDPHLSIQMPSIWYEIGLHCTPVGEACPFNVMGFSFAGTPAIIIGHNDRIAWGVTNVGPDVMDLFIEKINPANPNQYEVNGEWVDMTLVTEIIQTGKGEPVEVTVRYTRHGPLLSDASESMRNLGAEGGLQLPANYGIALRWTALEPGNLFHAILGFNKAQNWEEFRQAASFFQVPAQNLVYADVDGNIGYQMPGWIPIRASGNGRLPVAGWNDQHEWLGYIPFEELPYSFNPEQGYIATANNAVVGSEYPYNITTDWDYGYRAKRIVEMIETAPGPIDIAYIQKIHGDNYNASAGFLLPVLMQVPLNDARLENLRGLLDGWDGQNHMDSAPAALFEVFRKNLLAVTFQDDLPEDSWFSGSSRSALILQGLVQQPDSPWWDDRSTPEIEQRDNMFVRAFTLAVPEIEKLLGKDPEKWSWGDLHTSTFRNQSLGESGIAPLEAIFNRGGFRTSGGSSIVNATSWNAASGSYEVVSLPSLRMIIDLGDLSNSIGIHTTGQSGHAYHPNYIDMADLWRNIEYRPMLWKPGEVQAASSAHLRLVP